MHSVISVSQLNACIRRVLEEEPLLDDLQVSGEISNFYRHPASGHIYFTLKDEESRIRCVFFRGNNRVLDFEPEDGMQVIVCGRVSLYAKKGDCQFYVDRLVPDGIGALHIAFEQLKERLGQEGLFSEEDKKQLPFLPQTIGVVTSPTGAAVQDILSILHRRFSSLRVVISPARVEGKDAAESLRAALRRLWRIEGIDLIIVSRGGGSIESLWGFNDEQLARMIYSSPVPVISAVGHETDFTICDFVADRRAPTPSAGAELAVPERNELEERVTGLYSRLFHIICSLLAQKRRRLDEIEHRRVFQKPAILFEQYRQRCDELFERLENGHSILMEARRERVHQISARLDALSPLKTLRRGYAIVEKSDGGRPVTRIGMVRPGENLRVLLADGTFSCWVEGTERGGELDERAREASSK